MNIVLFTHPSFLGSQSMPRYANMLFQGMKERGHKVVVWSPKARFYKFPLTASLKKWMGYIDQYIVFPLEVKSKLRNCSKDTLFVFADQALGPWVPLVENKPHLVHCHDFLALKSAMGLIPENATSFTGKKYQNFIRKGFSKGKHFICISEKTNEDLQEVHLADIRSSVVCYNGLNRSFEPLNPITSRSILAKKLNLELSNGYILHIGGNQYYKNRKGVLEIYDTWRSSTTLKIPLILIGAKPTDELISLQQKSEFKKEIHFITGLSDDYINSAYSGASCLLFPSLDEGFGWPIAEGMASGCLVVTTNRAPMNEVGGSPAFYIDKRPAEKGQLKQWKDAASRVLDKVLSLNRIEREQAIQQSAIQSQKFDTALSLDAIEKRYKEILLKQ
jgi:glycosyltransferase involved in cell wall biosynthesis